MRHHFRVYFLNIVHDISVIHFSLARTTKKRYITKHVAGSCVCLPVSAPECLQDHLHVYIFTTDTNLYAVPCRPGRDTRLGI